MFDVFRIWSMFLIAIVRTSPIDRSAPEAAAIDQFRQALRQDLLIDQHSESVRLFEGDIVLTPLQAESLLENSVHERRGLRSAATADITAKWTSMPIHYDYDSSLGSQEKTAINAALEYWRTHTCLWFQYKPGIIDGDFLLFVQGEANTCFTNVGKVGGRQIITIGNNCAKLGYVAHEIGHSVGLWHEHVRPDSHNYIRVLWENIADDRASNFIQRSWQQAQTFGIPYDHGSVLQYGAYAFSADERSPTIQTRLPGYQRTIGQRDAPSFLDVKAVNMLYCENRCSTSNLACRYGGYVHPGFCDRCLCPAGLGGLECDRADGSINAACGGELYVTSDWTNFTSPNYPRDYGFNQRCNWLLKAPATKRIVLEFVDTFQMACSHTCVDYVEVKNGTDFTNTGMRFCCSNRPTESIYSQDNEMLVIFNSNDKPHAGFKARVAAR